MICVLCAVAWRNKMKLEVRKIDIKSLLFSALPFTIFCIAVLGGIITFFVIDNPQYATMSAGHKIISVALYSIIYVIMSMAVGVFGVFLYNLFGAVLGLRGITVDIEDADAAEIAEAEEE